MKLVIVHGLTPREEIEPEISTVSQSFYPTRGLGTSQPEEEIISGFHYH
jgi:hypothetical protein